MMLIRNDRQEDSQEKTRISKTKDKPHQKNHWSLLFHDSQVMYKFNSSKRGAITQVKYIMKPLFWSNNNQSVFGLYFVKKMSQKNELIQKLSTGTVENKTTRYQ